MHAQTFVVKGSHVTSDTRGTMAVSVATRMYLITNGPADIDYHVLMLRSTAVTTKVQYC
jgi:hypothetical protein